MIENVHFLWHQNIYEMVVSEYLSLFNSNNKWTFLMLTTAVLNLGVAWQIHGGRGIQLRIKKNINENQNEIQECFKGYAIIVFGEEH